jgi:hypothetical protein
MRYTATLIAYTDGRRWAAKFIDHETGKFVEGLVSGGESNICGIKLYWGVPDNWDRSILYHRVDMNARLFGRLTDKWEYAGCTSEELADYIRRGLAEQSTPASY